MKILPESQLARDQDALARFRRETRVVASLSHPNILAIHDVGIENGVSFAVMELLDGETLRQRIRGGPMPWSEVEEIGLQVARGMAAAHAKGIVHRDLKPENVFLTKEGGVKILDFGLARIAPKPESLAEDASTISMLTQPGMLVGTVSYMSPEQVRGDVVDARSDVFSFGSILYEMVSGRKAFERGTAQDTLAAILRDAAPLLPKELALPPGLRALIGRCLEKDPAQRFASGVELTEVLSGASAISGVRTVSGSRIRWPRRHRVLPWSAAVVAAGGAVTSVILFCGRTESIGSLAVLPLVNATGVDSLEYLSDGIAENLVDRMSRSSSLKVMAWSTVSKYKGRDAEPHEIGSKLHVAAFLTGRLALDRDVARLGVELVSTEDGRQIWGEHYERKLGNILDLEEEVAGQLRSALHLDPSHEERVQLTKHHTRNPDAYSLYLRGRYATNKVTMEGLRTGIELMKQAIETDPAYAQAYAGLASAYVSASTFLLKPGEAMPKARAAAEQAIGLDESLAEAHTVLAGYRYGYEWNWAEAEKEFRRSIELDPNLVLTRWYYSQMLGNLGRFDAAIEQSSKAQDLDPLTPWNGAMTAYNYYLARRYDQALAISRETLETDPDFFVAHYNIGEIYLTQGKISEALKEFEAAKIGDPKSPVVNAYIARAHALLGQVAEARRILADLQQTDAYVDPTNLAIIYEALGQKGEMFSELEMAYEARSENLLTLAVQPLFDSIRGDPRYESLVRRMGLVPK